jgi:hypothetical protein
MQDLAPLHKLLTAQLEENIVELENYMLTQEQVEIPVVHRYVNGMYIREITIPKDTVLTGRVHKEDYVDIMLSGDISVATPDGLVRLTGNNVLIGTKGRKRAGYAHEDTRWVTVHNVPIENSGENYVETMTFFSLKEYESSLSQLLSKDGDNSCL